MRTPECVDRGAAISACGQFRYQLRRVWDHSKPVLPWGLLNPSIADGERDDPTVRRVVGFTILIGEEIGVEYGGAAIFNAYAYRATKPAALARAGWPVGPDNDRWIIDTCALGDRGRRVMIGWGSHAKGMERPGRVLELLRRHGYRPMALKLTDDKLPWHPLMLAYEYRRPFEI